MRTLSGTLTAAQKAPAPRPHPKVEVFDKVAGVTRHHWERYYTGAEAEKFHAVTMPGDGSLIRLRTDAANNLYRQRVTDPDSGSTYSSWTDWGVDAFAVALASYGVNVWAFRIDATDGHLYRSDSTDNGASWGGWVDMGAVAGDATFRLAACAKSLTLALVIYGDGTALNRRRLSGGAWEAPAAWTNTLNSVTGVAAVYMGDWNIMVTGTDTSNNPGVWTCVLGDGYSAAPGNWSTLSELMIAEAASNVSYAHPALHLPDVYRAWFVESYSGNVAYSRPYWTHGIASADFISNLWREPVPFNLTSNYGLAITHKSPGVWLTRPDGVWYADLNAGSVELTTSVLAIKAIALEKTGEISVVLRNDDGRFDKIGIATEPYEHVKLGAELLFSPGYYTTGGGSPEHSTGPAYWIESFDYLSRGGKATLTIIATDGWGILERWKARRQYTWASGAKNIFQLLNFIHSRAGLEFSALGGSSAVVTDLQPAFTINPGESGKTAVLRLLAMIPDVLFFRGKTGYLKWIQSSDSEDYTYGTDHDILEAHYHTRHLASNRIQATNGTIIAEDFDWDEIDLVFDILEQDYDLALSTAARNTARAAAILRRSEIRSLDGCVLVPLNCGQELYDVIKLTDLRAPLSAEKRRVLGVVNTFYPAKAQYRTLAHLGAV